MLPLYCLYSSLDLKKSHRLCFPLVSHAVTTVSPLSLQCSFSLSPHSFWKVVGRSLSTWGYTCVEDCGVMVMLHSIISLMYQQMHVIHFKAYHQPLSLLQVHCCAGRGVGCKCCFSFLASTGWYILISVCVFLKNTTKECNSVPIHREGVPVLWWPLTLLSSCLFLVSLGLRPRALYMLGRRWTTDLHAEHLGVLIYELGIIASTPWVSVRIHSFSVYCM